MFEKKVSKGSRFNQVYIPKDMEDKIEVGDLVEVRLIKKHIEVYYHNVNKLSEFKKYLIKNIFSELSKINKVKEVFLVGSFLHDTIYNDIDLVIALENKELIKNIEKGLTKKFNQKFHVLGISIEKLRKLVKVDPITRAMFDSYVSNKEIIFDKDRTIDKNHINFLLMMPEDLLDIELSSKVFYDNIRRLVTIELFLQYDKLENKIIVDKVRKLLGDDLFKEIKNNLEINKDELGKIRKIIKKKIKWVKKMI